MKTPNLELDVPYVRSLTYGIDGTVNNSELAHTLTRGIGGVVDFFIAKDSERFLDGIVEKYGMDFKIEPSTKARIIFSPTVDGRKTAEALRGKGIYIPNYIKEIILWGKIMVQIPPERFQIFDVGDDPNARGNVPYFARKLMLPLEYILERWDFNLFENPLEIKERLRQALATKPQNPVLARTVISGDVQYDHELANTAFEMMTTKGVVKNLFGNNEWRGNAAEYGRALLDAVLQKLEKQKAEGIETEKEFLERLSVLFNYYHTLLIQY